MTTVASSTVQEMTREEFRRLLEQRAQREFGMSLDAFLKAFKAGTVRESSGAVELALLAGAKPR